MNFADRFFTDKRFVLALGTGLIVVTNVVALAGVAYNRAGDPDSVVTLSERELGMPYRYGMMKENTGIQLRVNCRVEELQHDVYTYSGCGGTPAWLDRDKLLKLGFRVQSASEVSAQRRSYRRELPREVYIVLEFDGAAYKRAVFMAEEYLEQQRELMANNPGREEFVRSLEQAQTRLNDEQQHTSRLFAIDAGQDKSALRTRYADASRYIFMRALVRPLLRTTKEGDEWIGILTGLLIDSINIPVEYRALFEHLDAYRSRNDPTDLAPRYEVQVAFGKRSEPWLLTARKL